MLVFLVMPDLSRTKMEALRLAKERGALVNVLVSATIIANKPSIEERLATLRREESVGRVMLDSGAYHHARGRARVEVDWYAEMAVRLAGKGIVDYIVAPDHPGDPKATLERTIRFAEIYSDPFIPVAQPLPGKRDPKAHAAAIEELDAEGILERAPRLPDGRILVGIGGLDGRLRRADYLSALVQAVRETWDGMLALHLFGVGARLLGSLARRGLAGMVYSVDSTAWLAEIRWRRRTVHRAATTLEANLNAMIAYLSKMSNWTIGGGP